jgi:hypothetical protein
MTVIGDIARAAKEIVGELTDIVGLIEKNISSFDRITARYRRKRVEHKLEAILQRLTTMHHSCHTTLWITARLAYEKGDKSLVEQQQLDLAGADLDLRAFLESLLEIRDMIDEYKSDIINTDYTIYERLDDCIRNRIRLVSTLLEADHRQYSLDKLKSMYVAYADLITSIKVVKDELANKLKDYAIQ